MWKWAMQGHPSKHVEFDVLVRIQNKVPWVVGDNSFRYQKRNGSRATGNKSSYGSGWEWTGRVKMENMCIRTHIHTDKKYEEIREREAISGKESACWYRRQWSWLIPGSKDPLEKEVVVYSSILDWEIPWTEEPGGLQSMGSQESDTN